MESNHKSTLFAPLDSIVWIWRGPRDMTPIEKSTFREIRFYHNAYTELTHETLKTFVQSMMTDRARSALDRGFIVWKSNSNDTLFVFKSETRHISGS